MESLFIFCKHAIYSLPITIKYLNFPFEVISLWNGSVKKRNAPTVTAWAIQSVMPAKSEKAIEINLIIYIFVHSLILAYTWLNYNNPVFV